MKTIGIIIAVIMVVGLGYIVISKPGAAESGQSANGSKQAPKFAAIQTDIEQGAKLLDVRTAGEYSAGHIDGAALFPVETITAGATPQVARDTKLYVYCRSGSRSAVAASTLTQAGFTNVVDLGAMTSVQAMGGKSVR